MHLNAPLPSRINVLCNGWFLSTFCTGIVRQTASRRKKRNLHPSPASSNTRHTNRSRLSVRWIEQENRRQQQREKLCVPADPPLTRQAGREAGAGLSAVAMDTVNESLSSPLVWLCSAYRHGAERPPPPPHPPPPPPTPTSSSPSAFFMRPI